MGGAVLQVPSCGYVVVVRCGDPPLVDLYSVAEAGRLLSIVAILENGEPLPPSPPPPEPERVKFIGPVNIRSGPGASYKMLDNMATGDIAEILERRRPGDWQHDWGRLGKIWRAGKERRLKEGEKWAYLARTEQI